MTQLTMDEVFFRPEDALSLFPLDLDTYLKGPSRPVEAITIDTPTLTPPGVRNSRTTGVAPGCLRGLGRLLAEWENETKNLDTKENN